MGTESLGNPKGSNNIRPGRCPGKDALLSSNRAAATPSVEAVVAIENLTRVEPTADITQIRLATGLVNPG